MTNFIKQTEAIFKIANELKPCSKAFKALNLEQNPKKAVDLSVKIAEKISKDYGLGGKAINYLEHFTTKAIQTFKSVYSDLQDHEYVKGFIDFTTQSKDLVTTSVQLVTEIKGDVKAVQSGQNPAIKQFKTDTTEAGIELFENIIDAFCSTAEGTTIPQAEL